jgi:hypothetical protein
MGYYNYQEGVGQQLVRIQQGTLMQRERSPQNAIPADGDDDQSKENVAMVTNDPSHGETNLSFRPLECIRPYRPEI